MGGYAVGNPTLNRFYSLHYLLPFVIAGVVVLHIWALHMVGQNNPTGVEPKSEKDTVAFTPYATVKDAFFMGVFCIVFAWFIFYYPELSRPFRQLHPGQSEPDADAHRSGMVLPAVSTRSCAPSRASFSGYRARHLHYCARLPALARYVARALGELPAALPAIPADLLRRRDRPRLSWLARASRRLCHRARILTAYYFAFFFIILPLLDYSRKPSRCRTRSRKRSCAAVRRSAHRVPRPRAARASGGRI